MEAGEHGRKADGWDGLASVGVVRATCWGHEDTIVCLPWCSACVRGERSRAVCSPQGPAWFREGVKVKGTPWLGCWCLWIPGQVSARPWRSGQRREEPGA